MLVYDIIESNRDESFFSFYFICFCTHCHSSFRRPGALTLNSHKCWQCAHVASQSLYTQVINQQLVFLINDSAVWNDLEEHGATQQTMIKTGWSVVGYMMLAMQGSALATPHTGCWRRKLRWK